MKLENPGTWPRHVIMKKFGVDKETANRLKFGEDVDITDVSQPTTKDDAAESEHEE